MANLQEIQQAYNEVWKKWSPPPQTLMSWKEFRNIFGENGEKLSKRYEVVDFEGIALVKLLK